MFLEKATKFFANAVELQSFPIFVGYVLMILLIPLWRRILPVIDNLKIVSNEIPICYSNKLHPVVQFYCIYYNYLLFKIESSKNGEVL